MTTSGTTAFTMTARQLVSYALSKIEVLSAGETPTAEDAEYTILELNMMLKELQIFGPNLWRQTEGSQTLSANVAAYTLLTKPFRISDCRFRQGGRDLPMELLTRPEYFDMPLKTSTGIPTQYYFDAQRDSGTLYIWPVMAAVAGETIYYTYQRRFEDVTSLDQTIDVPPEALSLIGYMLSARIADAFGADAQLLRAQADRMMLMHQSADREPEYRFQPSRR
jgi:hypothetical protein